jgi:FkbM family methyltransferase
MMVDLANYKSRLYYSQNREDLILKAFFPDEKNGFYVDVGGYDPDFESVTKLFYLEGWHGITIEPIPERWALFEKHRKRDTNVNVGVSDKKGTLTLRSYVNQGLSTFSGQMKDSYAKAPDTNTTDYVDMKVPVETLKSLLDRNKVTSIQFMKIDAEGFEHKVLAGNDWKKYRPEVLCIEANHSIDGWRELLTKNNYELAFNDGLNEYYTDKATNRKAVFDYVNFIVIPRGGGLRYDDFKVMKDQQAAIAKLEAIIAQADAELRRRAHQVVDLESRLIEQSSIHAVGRQLIVLLRQKIARTLGLRK